VEKFHNIAGMPCVVGAVNGTLTNIDVPMHHNCKIISQINEIIIIKFKS
jgi:hypothetical protein